MLAINMLYMCVTSISIGFHLNGFSAARRNAKELCEVLNEEPTIECNVNQHKESIKKPKLGRGAIKLHNVHFAYPSRPDIQVLKGISFTVEEGEHLAIVGASGSGKSTLTALLLRFYDPQSGTIQLDEQNIQKMSPDDLRAQIGLVSQEPVLFDGTISDNIRYGRLDATQAEINEAARKAEAWQFISALPQGMQTRVGDRGIQLSGGQKQRVAIARAVIRSPSVMIFDEATSALDSKHEAEVQKAIDAASQGLTTITIAHRLTTVRNADHIIVLENGQIGEEGPPEVLLSDKRGKFHRMSVDQQLDMDIFDMEDDPPMLRKPTPVDLAVTAEAARHRAKYSLAPTRSAGAYDRLDATFDRDAIRRAWARSSLGANRRSGRSYAVRNANKDRLAMPVMSKKRSQIGARPDIMGPVAADDDEYYDQHQLPGRKTNFGAVRKLVQSYKRGYWKLALGIPITVFRSGFLLLVAFEIPAILEISSTHPGHIMQGTLQVGAIFIALIITKTILEASGRLLVALYGNGFCEEMRKAMLRSILRHGAAYFDEENNAPGRLAHRVISDTATLNRTLASKINLLLPGMVCALISVSVAVAINWKLALLCGFQFPAFFCLRLVELRETTKRQRQTVEQEKKAANLASVVLSNMSTIKAYTLQEYFNDIFVQALEPVKRAMRQQALIGAFVYACQFSFSYILIAITLQFGKVMMLSNEVTSFNYMRVVLLLQFGAMYVSMLVSSVNDLSKARVAAENILQVINENALMDNLSEEGIKLEVRGDVRLEQVSFRFPTRPIVAILKNLSYHVEAGQSVAFVGPSGAGKSTIIQLVQRLYDPTMGKVTIDNHDIRTFNPAYLRRLVVSVSQEPELFSFNLKENIGYGLEPDEITDDKIEQAARLANIHEFIMSLPQGYDTEVGEFGAQLSGGQKQRVAIARAIIRQPVVLLLDEATAALDSASEKAVQTAIEMASQNRTCIIVAHRLSTIQHADQIVTLVDGDIAEKGTHHSLMEERGLYYEMVKTQESFDHTK